MSQRDRVVQYCKDFGSITALEAFRDIGVSQLHCVIYDLVHNYDDEYLVESEWETRKNRYGEDVTYKRYTISPIKKDGDQLCLM